MLISLNEIKKYVQIPDGITNQELINLIGSRLVEVETVTDLTPRYEGIYVAKVVKATPIEGTHLNLCEIDAGTRNQEFNQLENGLVQVVCGAPNVHAGMLAVWITPGSIIPETYGNENFKLSVRKLQGYESNGMLAGADELGFDTEHKTIAEIDPKIARAGDKLSDVFDLNDLIIEVENKSLTHRPDCFGLIGFAREVAGILGVKFQEIEWSELAPASELPLEIKIEDKDLCPRYSCAVFDLPQHEKSKYLTADQIFLAKAGMRSIDPMVDLTNILMLRTGQPLHAFDYDKLIAVGGDQKAKIIVRSAKENEEIQLLDGKVIQCIPEDILITSNNVPVALAGAMGGKNTEIDVSTRRAVLESATFSLYHLRKTQMAHGIFSEAITRFTKGQPAAMTLPVLATAVKDLQVTPLVVKDEWVAEHDETVITLNTHEVNQLLGGDYSTELITETLENVGFKVVSKEFKAGKILNIELQTAKISSMIITVPAWRTDIHIKEDIIEEVGRLLGYDNLPLALPEGKFEGTEIAPLFTLKSKLRNLLSSELVMHEVLTYSFISKSLLEKVGQSVDESYEIVNSISPELQCFRQQIVPSLLDKVRENLKSGHKNFTIYEMNQVTARSNGLDQDKVPVMEEHLGIVCLGDFYELKAKIFAALEHGLKIDIEYQQISPNSAIAKKYPYLEPVRSVELTVGGVHIGAFGEVKAAVRRRFKLEDQMIAAAELDLSQIVELEPSIAVKVELSKFPSVERDITFKVAADLPFGRVDKVLHEYFADQNLIYTIEPVSIYQAESDSKNLSFHLEFASPEHTLDAAQISAIMDGLTTTATKIGAHAI